MSSHHIVREKQEPALLVLGMDGFDDELLGQLLEWSPTVIVTETMAEKLNAAEVKIDWILTDDSNGDIQSDVKRLPLNHHTEIETAFGFLIESNYSAVNIVTDKFDLENYLPFVDKINLVIFNNNRKIYPVTSGFSKWKPEGESIEFLTIPIDPEINGLAHQSENVYLTKTDGLFTIQFSQPFLFIAENIS
jgi:thiamine pyrophosphokinase